MAHQISSKDPSSNPTPVTSTISCGPCVFAFIRSRKPNFAGSNQRVGCQVRLKKSNQALLSPVIMSYSAARPRRWFAGLHGLALPRRTRPPHQAFHQRAAIEIQAVAHHFLVNCRHFAGATQRENNDTELLSNATVPRTRINDDAVLITSIPTGTRQGTAARCRYRLHHRHRRTHLRIYRRVNRRHRCISRDLRCDIAPDAFPTYVVKRSACFVTRIPNESPTTFQNRLPPTYIDTRTELSRCVCCIHRRHRQRHQKQHTVPPDIAPNGFPASHPTRIPSTRPSTGPLALTGLRARSPIRPPSLFDQEKARETMLQNMKHQYKNNKTTTTNTCSQNQHTSLVDMQDWSAHVVYYHILLNVVLTWPFRCPPPNSTDSCLSVLNGSLPGLRSWLNAGLGFGWLLPTFEMVNACHR